nr:hotdog fold domain-containing protein [Hydrocarboniphaga sp.]
MTRSRTPAARKAPMVLSAWQRLSKLPFGARLFTRVVCMKAPYFASISPLFVELAPGHCVATVKKHRAITNHLGTVHAIALCNLAELVAGIMLEASVPPDTHRWIPKGMTVSYLKKVPTDVRAVARFATPPDYDDQGKEVPAAVTIYDTAGEAVFKAEIRMWVSPKPPSV